MSFIIWSYLSSTRTMQQAELCPRLEYPSKQALRQNGQVFITVSVTSARESPNNQSRSVRSGSTNSRVTLTICTVTRSTQRNVFLPAFCFTCIHATTREAKSVALTTSLTPCSPSASFHAGIWPDTTMHDGSNDSFVVHRHMPCIVSQVRGSPLTTSIRTMTLENSSL